MSSPSCVPITPLRISHARLAFARRETTVAQLMERFGRSDAWVRLMLRGKLDTLHNRNAISESLSSFTRMLTREQVIDARRAYKAREMNQQQLGRKLNMSQRNVGLMLSGETYKDIPEFVDEFYDQHRLFSDAEVTAMRLAYRDRKTSQTKLARKYGVHQKTISMLLRGITYKHLPYAAEDRDGKIESRYLTTEKVLEARRLFATGRFRVVELAAYYGLNKSVMGNALKGHSYADLPGAVPLSRAPKRSGRSTKMRLVQAMTVEERRMAKQSIEEMIAAYGTQRALARAIGIGHKTIYVWHFKGHVSQDFLERVSEVTGMAKERLRPDLFREGGVKPDYSLILPTRQELEMMVQLTLDELAIVEARKIDDTDEDFDIRPAFNPAHPDYALVD